MSETVDHFKYIGVGGVEGFAIEITSGVIPEAIHVYAVRSLREINVEPCRYALYQMTPISVQIMSILLIIIIMPGQILDKYWSDTIWQRTAQDRVIWRRHAEAFAQPQDTTAA